MLIDSWWSGKTSLNILVGGEALSGALATELADRGLSVQNL
jgi:hypothetical protein